jgi:hypothetical protein
VQLGLRGEAERELHVVVFAARKWTLIGTVDATN